MRYPVLFILILLVVSGCSPIAASLPATSTPAAAPVILPSTLTPAPTAPVNPTQVPTATSAAVQAAVLPTSTPMCYQSVSSTSPDGKTIASAPNADPSTLVLRNLATGSERRVKLESDRDVQAGNFIWSGDSSVLVLSLVLHPCDPAHSLYSIVRVEPQTLQAKTLLHYREDPVKPVMWKAPAIVWLQDRNGNTWMIDALTGASPTLK